MKASIVVATKDRGPDISRTIDSLVNLDFAPSDYEIIIADNQSCEANRKYLIELQRSHSNLVRYVREEELGLSKARNCGIQNSFGEIIAFIDDDAVAQPFWLRNLVKPFAAEANVFAAGGKVTISFSSPPPEWIGSKLALYLSSFDQGDKTVTLKYNEFPRGTNMAFRRKAFDECGLFLDCFGRKGASLMSYEEIELCYRIDMAGHDVVYVPGAEVEHLIRGDRLSVDWFKNRFYWQGRSEGLFETIHFGKQHILSRLRLHAVRSLTADQYDQMYHRGFLCSVLLNFFKKRFV